MEKGTDMNHSIKWIKEAGSAVSAFVAVNLIIYSLMFRRPKKHWEQDSYDCAVVCGCSADENGRPTDTMKSRVDKAVELWKSQKVGYLVLSGGAVYNDFIEAEVMKQYAMDQGVPEAYILEEKKAVSTYHNLQYAAEVMRNCGFADCVVVTSGWHLRKADHYARRAKVRYVMAPADEPEGQNWRETLRLYLETAIHMYVNMWKGYY